MSIFEQTKGTELEKTIAQLSQGEAIGGAMYYALAMIAREKFGLEDVAKKFIELGNQETNHGAFYAMLNGRYPSDENSFWQMIRGLSNAEFNGEKSVNELADKLANIGVASEVISQVRELATQERHHREVTKSILDMYAPKQEEIGKEKTVYVCTVCGFEYLGDLNKAQADYKCPICGCAKGVFKKLDQGDKN